MYNNAYVSPYNAQPSIDRINAQITELEKMRNQMQQPITPPTSLTQNFQLTPQNDVIKYANSIDEVGKNLVIGDTPYFSRDMSVVWIKNTKGDIDTYELKKIVPKDDKDLKIEYLQAQIEELKGMVKNEPLTNVDEPITKSNKDEKSASVQSSSKLNKK